MTVEGERWTTLRRLFDELVDLPADERVGRLDRIDADGEILAELRALLAAADRAGDFLEPPKPEEEPQPYSSLKPGERVGAL